MRTCRGRNAGADAYAQASDAYLFPLLGSCVLLSLFCAFKYLDKALVNRILGAYFVLMGTGGLARVSCCARA